MSGLAVVSAVLAAGWLYAALVVARRAAPELRRRLAACCLLPAAAHAAAASAGRLTPLIFGGWALFVLALPLLHGTPEVRRLLHWTASATVLAATYLGCCAALHLMSGVPRPLNVWLAAGFLVVPVAQVLAVRITASRAAARLLAESIALAGVAALIVAVYFVVVVGINGTPHGHERQVLLASIAAALVVAAFAIPVRHRVGALAARLVGETESSADDLVTGFGARMSRAVPMDELMLQLVESLHAGVADRGAEIWTGTDGVLTRVVSVPARPPARIELAERERVVVARARSGGPSWVAVWLPQLAEPGGDVRAVPVAHLGELLGLLVVRRRPDTPQFADEDEQALVEVARQLGLALHNVRLDSALQASLAELARRNEELQASRLRIVAAADMSRREIERNLHDGAQQHLVALAVKLGLTRQIAEGADTASVLQQLEELREDVQRTITELRELAHGIYPPLLRDRGLAEALRTAALRCPLPCTLDVQLPGRYPEAVETTAYFCCLEGMQNAGKYAGDGATLAVRVSAAAGNLCVELADDGAGFDPAETPLGNGFVNMQDRLGALGGRFDLHSAPGTGTTVRATIPAEPLGSRLSG